MFTEISIPRVAPIIQGDVLLKKISSLPPEAKLVTSDAKILQASEVTGHHHQFTKESRVDLYQVPTEVMPGIATITDNQGKIINVIEPSWLFHGKLFEMQPHKTGTGDHAAIQIQPGIYVVDIVREWDYNFNELSRVVD